MRTLQMHLLPKRKMAMGKDQCLMRKRLSVGARPSLPAKDEQVHEERH